MRINLSHCHFLRLFDISNPMLINEAPLQKNLIVRSFSSQEKKEISDIESRLMHLGFFWGETIRITHRAPFFQQPYLVEVRGRLVALSQEEASMIEVEVVEE